MSFTQQRIEIFHNFAYVVTTNELLSMHEVFHNACFTKTLVDLIHFRAHKNMLAFSWCPSISEYYLNDLVDPQRFPNKKMVWRGFALQNVYGFHLVINYETSKDASESKQKSVNYYTQCTS